MINFTVKWNPHPISATPQSLCLRASLTQKCTIAIGSSPAKDHNNICNGMKWVQHLVREWTTVVIYIGITTIMWWQADSVAYLIFHWVIAYCILDEHQVFLSFFNPLATCFQGHGVLEYWNWEETYQDHTIRSKPGSVASQFRKIQLLEP